MPRKQREATVMMPDVVLSPEEVEKQALREDMNLLDGSESVGPLSYVTVPRPQGGVVYLSGMPYLFSNFGERAYMIGEHTAHELVVKYPLALKGAVVVPRSR
jgi:hypothetical protein